MTPKSRLAILVAAALMIDAGTFLAAHAATSPLGCPAGQSINDVAASYSPDDMVALYPFTGAEAKALIAAATKHYGAPPGGQPTQLVVAYVPGSSTLGIPSEVDVYAFDVNGCFDAEGQLQVQDALSIFTVAGVTAPFGTTFYKAPGSP